jgi:hypothetical protein
MDGTRAIVSFDGVAECARAVDLVLEAPYRNEIRVAIFENPFGTVNSRPNTVFLRQLKVLTETRSDVIAIVTSRPKSYLRYEAEIAEIPHYCTPLIFSDWYATEALDRYARCRREGGLSQDLHSRLSTPALIDDFIRHDMLPTTDQEREILRARVGRGVEDVTLDKFNVFEERQHLGLLAALLRLQELAPILPSAHEICSLVGIDPLNEPHLGLVAVTYEFDGLERLRFEHATTREAADIVLRALAEGGFKRLHELERANKSAGWLGRAIELWSAQQDVREGRWDVLRGKPEDVRLAICSDMLGLTSGHQAAIDVIEALDYDAWTAQDLAYEIASGWPEYVRSTGVADFLGRIVANEHVDGVYALLEALLYIRSKEVSELWQQVDRTLVALARNTTEVPRQLLLAVDGLAWRPPPVWHQLGGWCRMLVDRLSPEHDAWGFVRFMTGYHPEGVAYLQQHTGAKIEELVKVDQGITWSVGQAKVAAWLVQWHFVHQCRARSQLARQPWVDQSFLCRSFHEVVPDPQRDHEAARLVHSLAFSYTEEPGWGFFLAENIRTMPETPYGGKTRLAAEQSLAKAQPGDTGVLAAVLTYSVDPRLLSQVRSWFQDDVTVASLLDALVDGLVVQGVRLLEPRFVHRRSLSAIYSTCNLDWEHLKSAIPGADLLDSRGKFDVDGLIRRLEAAATDHPMRSNPHLDSMLSKILRRVRCGDLRPLVSGPRGANSTDPLRAYRDLLEFSANQLSAVRS